MAQGIFRAAMNDAREVLGEARIEQPEHPLVSYACVDEPKQHRTTAVDEQGRQHGRQVQIIQLMCWALELVHGVWRLPRDPRAAWAPRLGHALNRRLFD